jgi:hypothetical protein
MACARCDFYIPKDSTLSQLLEAHENLQRMLITGPLADDERAAVEDGQAALDSLVDKLAEVPSPAGPTPRELGTMATVTVVPDVEFRPARPTARTRQTRFHRVTVVVDHDFGRLVWAGPGRDKATLKQSFDLLGEARSQLVKLVCADAAEWIATVVGDRAPNATLCADAFHMASWATKALDEVRREIWR